MYVHGQQQLMNMDGWGGNACEARDKSGLTYGNFQSLDQNTDNRLTLQTGNAQLETRNAQLETGNAQLETGNAQLETNNQTIVLCHQAGPWCSTPPASSVLCLPLQGLI